MQFFRDLASKWRVLGQIRIASAPGFALALSLTLVGSYLGQLPAVFHGRTFSFWPSFLAANHRVVRVFYATDRNRTSSETPNDWYGSRRAPDQRLALGECEVSIPIDEHRIGRVERPGKILWVAEYRENPDHHVVLKNVRPKSYEEFYGDLERESGGEREAFVFVHGFNVSFAEAVRQAAVIAYDVKFPGAPIVYSWPAASLYPEAESNIDVTIPRFQWFLEDIVRKTHVAKIHLIAHSMGNRIVSRGVARMMSQSGGPPPHFQQILLTAPDIDREELSQLSARLREACSRVTLYTSGRDEAILLSREFHQYPRAGDTLGGVFLAPGVDTIDATQVDTELGTGHYGHDYPTNQRDVLDDIGELLWSGRPPVDRRGVLPVPPDQNPPKYWRLSP